MKTKYWCIVRSLAFLCLNAAAFAQPCAPGSFSASGFEPCQPCPAGSFSNLTGATSCFPCQAGTFNSQLGATQCLECPCGTFASTTGSTSCNLCPSNTYQPSSGAVSCFSCASGQIAAPGSCACQQGATPCAPGSFSASGFEPCQPCPAGSFSNLTGATNCVSCPAGTFQSLSGSTSCVQCPAGTFQSLIGSTSCVQCPAGTFQSLSGSTSCVQCPCDQVSPPGAVACQVCFGEAAFFITQPTDVTVAPGQALNLFAVLNPPPPGSTATYQWRRNRVPLVNGGHISGADSPSLTISNATPSDSGAYDLVIAHGTCPLVRSQPAAGLVVSPSCPGDADGNGVVNFADITKVLSNFNLLCF